MRFRGYTDSDAWNIQALLWMMAKGEYWHAGVTWKEWGLSASYTWYDGPIWQVCIGPFWISIAAY